MMNREEIDKIFQEAYELESKGQKNNAYRLYMDAISNVKRFRKLAPIEDHESIDMLIKEVSDHAEQLFKEISEGISRSSNSISSSSQSHSNQPSSSYHASDSNNLSQNLKNSNNTSSKYYSSYSSSQPSYSSSPSDVTLSTPLISSGNEAFSMSVPPTSSAPHPIDLHPSAASLTAFQTIQTNIQTINNKYKITQTINKGAAIATKQIVDFSNEHHLTEKISTAWIFTKNLSTTLCWGPNKVIKKIRGIEDGGDDTVTFKDAHVGGF